MIVLENSEEAINGLAKLITQDPIFPIWLKKKQDDLIRSKSMKDNKEYIASQKGIIEKAENIASSNIGYIFDINAKKEYMIYKKIDNELIPIIKEFETSIRKTFSFNELISYLKNSKITKLITFNDAQIENYFYTHPIVREREGFERLEEYAEDFISHNSYHNPVSFNIAELEMLDKIGVNLNMLNKDERKYFTKGLKQVTDISNLKPLEDY